MYVRESLVAELSSVRGIKIIKRYRSKRKFNLLKANSTQ